MAARKPLPIAGSTKIRPSRKAKQRAAVLIGVHLVIIAHVAHWRLTGSTLSPLEPSEAMELAKHGVINAGLVFFAAAILSTALFGRFVCGWGCHLVALQDLSGWLLRRVGIRPQPLRSRLLRWVPMLAFLYMFLWPAAYRLWIGDRFDRFEVDLTTEGFWATFPGWTVALATLFICGFAAVYFLGAKGFCTYACPYGAVLAIAEKLSPVRIRVTDACAGCGHCTAVCTSNVRVHEEVRDFRMVVDSGCMKCMDCVSVCPNDALYLGRGKPALLARPTAAGPRPPHRTLSWREELVLGLAFGLAFFTFRGLYGVLPFLFSLGLAGVLAYLCLTLARLVRRPHLRLRRWRLKHADRLLPAGKGFAATMALLFAVWAHSALIQLHSHLGERSYRQTAGFRGRVLADATAPVLSTEERQPVESALRHLGFVADRGLLAQPRLRARIAWLSLLAGRREAFLQRAEEALTEPFDHATVHLLLARHHAFELRYEDAAGAYERSIHADPGIVHAHLGLGTLLAQLGHLEAAGQVFERGIAALPEVAGLYYNAGLVQALSGNPEGAIEKFERALALEPGNLPARENLAGVLAGVGRFRESVGHYRIAVQQNGGDAATHLLLARALLAMGEIDEAETELRRARALDPSLPEGRRLLAELATRPGASAEIGTQNSE